MLNILKLSLEHFVSIVRNYIILEKSKSHTQKDLFCHLYVIIAIVEELLASQVFLMDIVFALIIFARVDLNMKK